MVDLTVATFKWGGKYTSENVNTLARAVRRHCTLEHEFVCITDDPSGLECRSIPLWDDWSGLLSPHHKDGYPSCYRRLKVFSPEIEAVLGRRFVVIDIDVLPVASLDPLWNRTEDFVCLANPVKSATRYVGGMWLITAGSRPEVWERMSSEVPRITYSAGLGGSDQAWISYCLPPDEATWGAEDGVYAYRQNLMHNNQLPNNARFVSFNGRHNPWDADMQRIPWIREHWC